MPRTDMDFQDYFSKQAETYRLSRPTYPDELFQYLVRLTNENELCWDAGAGNGQASVALSRYFKSVMATEPSSSQLANAQKAENLTYRNEAAEKSSLGDGTVDLITVAQAAHWFDLDTFYAEARRVAKPKGIIAIWTYSEAKIHVEIDTLMEWFMYDFLKIYWPDARSYVRNKYLTLPFPFEKIATPSFFCEVVWNKSQWLNYIISWSATQQYINKTKENPLDILLPKLDRLWKDDDYKTVIWPLHLLCGAVHSSSK